MRHYRGSALWGKPSKAETRASALWGKAGRGVLTALTLAFALAGPAAATADSGDESGTGAFASPGLLERAQASPEATFDVIVQGEAGDASAEVADDVIDVYGKVKRKFLSVAGVAATLSGRHLLKLADDDDVFAITTDAPVRLSGFSTGQQWPYAAGVVKSWWDNATNSSLQTPTIAVVDSGIDGARPDFGGRVVAEVNLTSLRQNSPRDGRGHGTFVAGIAAGGADGYAGANPRAKIVSIDVMDDSGMAMTRDVIAAADWIYTNKDAYGIRVANFSLHSSVANSFMFDPLNKAVEKLWLNGVVVVAAAGNYGVDGEASGVPFAPGNDPFVITVGAVDIDGSVMAKDDFAAPWSAYGYTLDGFAKPDLAAPGRYKVGPVPMTSTLARERSGSIVADGYIRLSGTSFAAPVVSGAAAYVLAAHPSWTPDQVKGALMLTTKATPSSAPLSTGVGEVNAAAAVDVTSPPNPNLALNRFLVSESGGSGKVFDATSWASAAKANASWASASWSSASWSSASWSSASWASASWASASWASASWASDSWADASWSSVSWADNAAGE
jgi:serine protease AprX